MSLSSHVSTASGQKMLVAEGSRLVFGRGPGVDLIIAAGRGLSRRAGLVTAMAAGVWIANISRTHALYVEGEGYQVRLPRMEHDGEPASGWFVHTGTALVGSRAMLDDGQSLIVTVTGQYEEPAADRRAGWAEDTELPATGLTGGRLAATGLALGMMASFSNPERWVQWSATVQRANAETVGYADVVEFTPHFTCRAGRATNAPARR